MSEAHEFIGRDRKEALEKALAYFGVGEDELAIAEVDATKASGLGTRVALVVYRRAAGHPSTRAGAGGGEGRRGGREGGREREARGRGGRGREEERGRGRSDERGERGRRGGRNDRDRGGERERAERRAAAEPVGPSVGTARGELGEIGSFVKGLVERMGLGPFEIGESRDNEDVIVVQLSGPGATRLAGGDGRAVDAVQLLANQVSMRVGGDEAKRVVIEVEGSTDQRADLLSRIAERAAQRARETGRPVALEAMSPRDRRAVHVALRDVEGIATMSVGEGRYRQVVVVPDSAPEYEEARRYESQSRDHRD